MVINVADHFLQPVSYALNNAVRKRLITKMITLALF